jgi:hypothetical protein
MSRLLVLDCEEMPEEYYLNGDPRRLKPALYTRIIGIAHL